MIDPLSVASSIISLSSICIITVKRLNIITTTLKDAPKIISDLYSSTKVISISLSQLHSTFLGDEQSVLIQALLKPDVRNALDIALTGCATTLGCIENETRSLTTKIESDQKINFSDRAKVVWRNDRFKELVEQLHRQHNVIAILQQGLQMKVLADIIPLLKSSGPAIRKIEYDTESLRGLYPQVTRAKSFLESVDSSSQDEPTFSIISERQFEFDDIVTNSQAYRRIVVAATRVLTESQNQSVLAEKDNNVRQATTEITTQVASQSRKVITATSTRAADKPEQVVAQPIATDETPDFMQHLRGYADHVAQVERVVLNATEETARLREESKEKDVEIQTWKERATRVTLEQKRRIAKLEETIVKMKDKFERDMSFQEERFLQLDQVRLDKERELSESAIVLARKEDALKQEISEHQETQKAILTMQERFEHRLLERKIGFRQFEIDKKRELEERRLELAASDDARKRLEQFIKISRADFDRESLLQRERFTEKERELEERTLELAGCKGALKELEQTMTKICMLSSISDPQADRTIY